MTAELTSKDGKEVKIQGGEPAFIQRPVTSAPNLLPRQRGPACHATHSRWMDTELHHRQGLKPVVIAQRTMRHISPSYRHLIIPAIFPELGPKQRVR